MNTSSFLLYAALVMQSVQAWAQSPQPGADMGSFHRLELGVHVSPDMAHRLLRNNNGDQFTDMIIDNRNEREAPKPGVTAGLSVGYRFLPWLGLETGVVYSNKGFLSKKRALTFGTMIDPRYGFQYQTSPEGNTPTHVRIIDNFHYVGIPLKVNFRVGAQRWKFVAGIGATAEFLTAATGTMVLYMSDGTRQRETEPASEDFRIFSLSPMVSVGVEYALTPNMALRAEPVFRFGALQIIDTPVTGHLYSAGLQLGYHYLLR